MTGSSLILIVVPIMAFVAMFFWLGLVFYADSHPGYRRVTAKSRKAGRRVTAAEGPDLATGGEPEDLPGASAPGPGDHERIHERIDDTAAAAASR